jgi:twinkle protein
VQLTKHKDANDYLQHGDDEELRKIWWNSKRFLPEGIKSSRAEFEELIKQKPKKGIDYPFPTLNRMLYGIRTGESVLLTANEGVGKTEIMRTIEYKLLTETDYAIGSIFLEEPGSRHLQGLAGIRLKSPVHLPDVGASDVEVLSALREVVGQDDRLHLYSHFGTDDPDVLLDTIRFLVSACNCRFILLDHITMAVSGSAQEDERKALDYLATRLEMMVKELDFGLIFVSHINDEGKTRGSRYISKVADIWIDAKRDIEAGSLVTALTIKKNRFSGTTGPAGQLLFDPSTYTLTEFGSDAPNLVPDLPPVSLEEPVGAV